ncbi:MAG: ATP synthase subunit I [Cocleimonas sp.]|nr:ATP synthase subunit I [Cocleimonas sp.]
MQSFLWAQTLLILAGTVFSYYYMGDFGAQSAAYGGGIALFSSLILMRRTKRAMRSVEKGSPQVMGLLYIGVIQRYVFVLLGLGVGLGLLKLNAKPLLIVFGIAQLAYFMPWLGKE